MRFIALTITFACLLATNAGAQIGPLEQARACAGIPSALQRLDCYDSVVKANPAASAPTPPRSPAAQAPQFRDYPATPRPPGRNASLVLT